MSFLGKLFGKGKKGYDDKQMAMMHGVLTNQSGMSTSDREALMNLGINREMITDDNLFRILGLLTVRTEDNGDGKPIVQDINPNMLAIRIMASQLIRCSFVDPIDAEIAMLESDRLIKRIEIVMDEDTYEYGGANFLDACNEIIKTAWCDAKNGRKAKLLKVMLKSFEITMPEVQKKREAVAQ